MQRVATAVAQVARIHEREEVRWRNLSDDGRYVAFLSWANNLVPADYNNVIDTFVHDRLTDETRRESIQGQNTQAWVNSRRAVISGDGRHVAIWFDHSSYSRIHVRDRFAAVLAEVSLSHDGSGPTRECLAVSISGNGRYVGFMSLDHSLASSAAPATLSTFVAPNPL